MKIDLPPKDRFDLPEVLEFASALGLKREDLYEYLRRGELNAFACPYRLEPAREVPIKPDEWPEWFHEPWEFPIYDGWVGDMNYGDFPTRIPLQIIPRAAKADTTRKLADGNKAATTATVFVHRHELKRFLKWYQNPKQSRPEHRRPGAGRPKMHDYTAIDNALETLFLAKGRSGFERPSDVLADLADKIGRDGFPPDSTLRNHIKTWLDKRHRS